MNDVAYGKYFVHARVEKDLLAATATSLGLVHSAPMPKLLHALRPGAFEQLLKALDRVTVDSVRAAIGRVFRQDHRVVVVTLPRK